MDLKLPKCPAMNLVMSARTIAWVLGGAPTSGDMPARVPPPLSDLLRRLCDTDSPESTGDAWRVKELVDAAARGSFSPPRFIPFTMPGWR